MPGQTMNPEFAAHVAASGIVDQIQRNFEEGLFQGRPPPADNMLERVPAGIPVPNGIGKQAQRKKWVGLAVGIVIGVVLSKLVGGGGRRARSVEGLRGRYPRASLGGLRGPRFQGRHL